MQGRFLKCLRILCLRITKKHGRRYLCLGVDGCLLAIDPDNNKNKKDLRKIGNTMCMLFLNGATKIFSK